MAKWDKQETFRKQARGAGYRSRAAYKLLEIEKRFAIFRGVTRIVDLCCAPGSWLQVITQHCRDVDFRIIGVDITYVTPIEGVEIIQSSIDSPDLVSRILEQLGGRAQLLLSDCSPKLTGNKSLDRERQTHLAKRSLTLALELLCKGGHFLTKLFQSDQTRELVAIVEELFEYVKLFKPKASLKRSPEMYLVAKSFTGHISRSC